MYMYTAAIDKSSSQTKAPTISGFEQKTSEDSHEIFNATRCKQVWQFLNDFHSSSKTLIVMAFSAQEIVERIMAKSVRDLSASVNPFKKYHVSQTAEQLPDIRLRNSWYQKELLQQIEEKREMERKRKELEAEEEERLNLKIEAEREKLRREFIQEQERRAYQIEEAKRRQAVVAARLEEIRVEAERKKAEEAEKRKSMYYDYLYNQHVPKAKYYKPWKWNSKDYVDSALNLHLEEIYKTAPLHMLADVYKQLEVEKTKMREIIRRRISEGE